MCNSPTPTHLPQASYLPCNRRKHLLNSWVSLSLNGEILCNHSKSGMRELWVFYVGDVWKEPSDTVHYTTWSREKIMCKAQETRKKLAHLGTANRHVWGSGTWKIDRNQIVQGLINYVKVFGVKKWYNKYLNFTKIILSARLRYIHRERRTILKAKRPGKKKPFDNSGKRWWWSYLQW